MEKSETSVRKIERQAAKLRELLLFYRWFVQLSNFPSELGSEEKKATPGILGVSEHSKVNFSNNFYEPEIKDKHNEHSSFSGLCQWLGDHVPSLLGPSPKEAA